MEYEFPSNDEFLKREEEQFSSHYAEVNGRRIYDSVRSAEEAHYNLQIDEMKKYAKTFGVVLDEIKDTQLIAKICSGWIIQYADRFADFWERIHKKIPAYKVLNNKI